MAARSVGAMSAQEGALSPGTDHPVDVLRRRGRRLEIITTAWNAGEVAATLTLGLLASSLALIAFGLDSLVEVLASVVVLWHLGGLSVPRRSRRAWQLVGVLFFGLGLYLCAAAIDGLVARPSPARSPAGVAFLGVTVIVMITLARSKRRVGLQLGSSPLVANATMTLLDGALAGGVLLSLVLDLFAGWWWADPVAALAIGVVAVGEGFDNLRRAR